MSKKTKEELAHSYKVRADKKRAKFAKKIIKSFEDVHEDRYDYSKFVYAGAHEKGTIICSEHGEFQMRPMNHKIGQGCPQCYLESKSGWSKEAWVTRGSISTAFDSYKVYMIKCWNDKETFYKIGKTFRTVESRFDNKGRMPYKWEIINIIENADGLYIHQLEKDLHKMCEEFGYIPKKTFEGMYECYSQIITK